MPIYLHRWEKKVMGKTWRRSIDICRCGWGFKSTFPDATTTSINTYKPCIDLAIYIIVDIAPQRRYKWLYVQSKSRHTYNIETFPSYPHISTIIVIVLLLFVSSTFLTYTHIMEDGKILKKREFHSASSLLFFFSVQALLFFLPSLPLMMMLFFSMRW